jgi:hypothetical protein
MNHHSAMPPIEWAKRVNGTWLVRGGLNTAAAAWLEHLETHDPGRLLACCEAARAMCELRPRLSDPKPWFYAGLFSRATEQEAQRFVAGHRITKAAIPAMQGDGEVKRWLDRAGPETRELIDTLRSAVAGLNP